MFIRVLNSYTPQNAAKVYNSVLKNCETSVDPLFLSHRNLMESLHHFVVCAQIAWYAKTSNACTIA